MFRATLCFLALESLCGLSAQNIDTVIFGDAASEQAHQLDAHFPPPTPVDQKYTNPPASDPSESPPSDIMDGALGLKARRLLFRSPVADINGGEITLTMKVDPLQQNYFSTKFWGSDSNPGLMIVYCDGFEIGARHGVEETGLSFMLNNGAWFPDRFWYRTVRLPLYLTYGKTTTKVTLRWTGNLNYYNNSSYVHYQDLAKVPSQPLYAAYTHVGSYVDTASEKEAPVPAPPPLRQQPGPEAIDHFRQQVNDEIRDRLGADDFTRRGANNSPGDAQFLAQCYTLRWTDAYRNPAVPEQILEMGDYLTNYFSPKGAIPGEGFGSGAGPWGWAVKIVWPAIQNRMDEPVDFGGTLGTVTRREGWGKMLRASIDNQRFDRKKIFNQETDGDFQLYMANSGLELVNPDLALTETEALRYVKEGMGIQPWAGNDQPDEPGNPRPIKGTYPNGPNWYTSTSRGTLKDGSYMPTGDYGEQGEYSYNLALITGDEEVRARAVQIEKARLPFRFPSVDSDGFKVMTVSEPIGSRNKGLPGHDAYLNRCAGSIFVAHEDIPEFTSVFQEMLDDGQLYKFATEQSIRGHYNFGAYMPDDFQAAMAKLEALKKSGVSPQKYYLPMADGMPDFAWGDEDNMVVAAKHGDERLFAALARDFVNGSAIVFEVTPQIAHIGEVQEDDVQFVSSGEFKVPNGYVEQWDWAQPPDNDTHPNAMKGRRQPIAVRPDMAGVPLASYQNQDGGRARAYTFRYGHFLVGMNMDARYNHQDYRVKTPAEFTSGVDLVSGKTLSAPVVIPPGSTVVFYLPKASSPNPPPASPLVFTGLAGNSRVALDWDASSGAQSFTVKRSETSGGPYQVVIAGIKGLNYVDTKVASGATYYYVLTGVGAAGESDPSPELKIIVNADSASTAPWLDQDIGKVNVAGSSSVQNRLDNATLPDLRKSDAGAAKIASVSIKAGGDDIYQGPDSFHFVCQPVTGDCTIVAQIRNQSGGNDSSKAGVMFRSSLDAKASMAALLATPQHGAHWSRRGAGFRESILQDFRTPGWLRLSRKGTLITASTSTNGVNWTDAGSEDIPQLLPTLYVGLCATARDNSTTTVTDFDEVRVTTP